MGFVSEKKYWCQWCKQFIGIVEVQFHQCPPMKRDGVSFSGFVDPTIPVLKDAVMLDPIVLPADSGSGSTD